MCIMCAARIAVTTVEIVKEKLDQDFLEGCEVTLIIKTPEGQEIPFVVASSEPDIRKLPARLEELCDFVIRSGAMTV